MKKFTVSEACERFAEVLALVEHGEEITLTRDGSPVAMMSRPAKTAKDIAEPGWAKREGWSIEVADDFYDYVPPGLESS